MEKILGYKQLSEEVIKLVNDIKDYEISIVKLINHIDLANKADSEWLNIARVGIQTSFMQLVKAVTMVKDEIKTTD